MLTVLHICSFLMSYDGIDRYLGDIETTVYYSHIKQSVQRDILWLVRVNLIFNCMIHTLEDGLIVHAIFPKAFWHLSGKSGLHVFKSAQYVFHFTPPDFHIIPGKFRCLPGRKRIPRPHHAKCLKIWHFSWWVK